MRICLIALIGVAIGLQLGGDRSINGLAGAAVTLVVALQAGYLLGAFALR